MLGFWSIHLFLGSRRPGTLAIGSIGKVVMDVGHMVLFFFTGKREADNPKLYTA